MILLKTIKEVFFSPDYTKVIKKDNVTITKSKEWKKFKTFYKFDFKPKKSNNTSKKELIDYFYWQIENIDYSEPISIWITWIENSINWKFYTWKKDLIEDLQSKIISWKI